MESFEKAFYKRLAIKSEALIKEYDKIDKENRKYLDSANKSGNVPLDEVNARMKFARENLKRLQEAKTKHKSLLNKLGKL